MFDYTRTFSPHHPQTNVLSFNMPTDVCYYVKVKLHKIGAPTCWPLFNVVLALRELFSYSDEGVLVMQRSSVEISHATPQNIVSYTCAFRKKVALF